MIDAIKIQMTKTDFRNMGGNLDNCLPIKGSLIKDVSTNGQPSVIRELYLPNPRKAHNLRVSVDEWGRVSIYGSIRKWWFGKSSFADLTLKQCYKAVSEIAELLNISPKIFMAQCALTHIELGYNILMRYESSDIIKRINKIGKIQGRSDYHAKHETLYFNGKDINVKIYDKCLEIPKHIRQTTMKEKVFENINRLEQHGNHILRVEVEMINSCSFKKYGLGTIKSFDDIFENWNRLHLFLVSVIARIKVSCPPKLSNSMTPMEKAIAESIKKYGFEKGVKLYADKVCKSSDIARIKRLAYYILENYPSKKTFNIQELRKAVARKLIRIHRHKEKIPLSNLFHALWNTKYYRKLKSKKEHYIIRQE